MKLRIAYNEQDAWAQIDELDMCINCRHMVNRNLFGGTCLNPEGERPFKVDYNNKCECFMAIEKRIEYWIGKLTEMALEFNGQNDFMRQLAYHQEKGTDHKFLFGS